MRTATAKIGAALMAAAATVAVSQGTANAEPDGQEKVNLAPGEPWVFETTLEDPGWAILTVSSTTRGGQAAPNAHCDIAVDGQVLVQHDDPYNVRCQLSQW
jgi:hypothetical protein